MELLHIDGSSNQRKCAITVTNTNFCIEGDFYHLVNKEFRPVKNGRDTCSIKEYMGLGNQCKRSPKKLIRFVVLACILEFFDMIAGKLSDYLFFLDTGWIRCN